MWLRRKSKFSWRLFLLILISLPVLSGCAGVRVRCGIPYPNDAAIDEIEAEAKRALAGKKSDPVQMPGSLIWHKEIVRACGW